MSVFRNFDNLIYIVNELCYNFADLQNYCLELQNMVLQWTCGQLVVYLLNFWMGNQSYLEKPRLGLSMQFSSNFVIAFFVNEFYHLMNLCYYEPLFCLTSWWSLTFFLVSFLTAYCSLNNWVRYLNFVAHLMRLTGLVFQNCPGTTSLSQKGQWRDDLKRFLDSKWRTFKFFNFQFLISTWDNWDLLAFAALIAMH